MIDRRDCLAPLTAMVLLLSLGDARADADEAARWLATGNCAHAGAAINEGMEHDDARAFRLAGSLYSNSGCVEEDLPRAARYYQRAVELGDPVARRFLGFMYGTGQGVPQDYRVAYRWYSYRVDGSARALEPDVELAAGYAATINQFASIKVRYPSGTRQVGTVYALFHSATRQVTFSSEAARPTQATRKLLEPSLFTDAISEAYAQAVQQLPVPRDLPSRDVVFETPWTFELR